MGAPYNRVSIIGRVIADCGAHNKVQIGDTDVM